MTTISSLGRLGRKENFYRTRQWNGFRQVQDLPGPTVTAQFQADLHKTRLLDIQQPSNQTAASLYNIHTVPGADSDL